MSYSCHHYEKQFICISERDTSSRTRIGEKPFLWKLCQKAFSENYNLMRHTKLHLGEKLFPCYQCLEVCSDNGNL